jgi:hypothetical protein
VEVESTPVPTPLPTAVPIPGPGGAWVVPQTQSVANGSTCVVEVHANTGTSLLAGYGIQVTFDSTKVHIASSSNIVAMSTGFMTAANINTPGKAIVSGFNVSGKGPSTDLGLFQITFTANGIGTSNVGITINTFADGYFVPIGTPGTRDGSITVIQAPPRGPGGAWTVPQTQSVANGSTCVLEIHANTGTSLLTAYGMEVTFDSAILNIASSSDVVAMPTGFLSAKNISISGKVLVSGFDIQGKGPSTDLGLFQITFTAVGRGTSNLGLTITVFSDPGYVTIGTQSTRNGSITVN